MLRTRLRWLVLLLVLFFVATAMLVVRGTTLPGDDAVLRALGGMRTDGRTAVMRFFTLLGSGTIEIPGALALVVFLVASGRRRPGWSYFGIALGGEALYALLKQLFHRPRPQVIPHLTSGGWYSFPSGHSMLAPVIWSLGLVLLARLQTRRAARIILLTLAALLPVAIGASRLYLGVHYPSDVVAGLALGSAWALFWDLESSLAKIASTSDAPATR